MPNATPEGIWGPPIKRKRCQICLFLTYKWQRVNGGLVHCFDGCKSTSVKPKEKI